jgi:hypothetical protein
MNILGGVTNASHTEDQTMSKPVIEQVRKPKGKSDGLWLVKVDGAIRGMLMKYNNTRTETHPWKAFAGHGHAARYLGAFYVTGAVPDDGHTQFGGKDAAIAAVLGA